MYSFNSSDEDGQQISLSGNKRPSAFPGKTLWALVDNLHGYAALGQGNLYIVPFPQRIGKQTVRFRMYPAFGTKR